MVDLMPKRSAFLQKLGMVGLVLLLVVNILVLARAALLYRPADPQGETDEARQAAYALAAYYRREADRRGLSENPAVREALAGFSYEVEQAVTPEAVAMAMTQQGRVVEATLQREEEAVREQYLLQLISSDPRVAAQRDPARILVGTELGQDGSIRVVVEDTQGVLSPETRSQLLDDPVIRQLTRLVEVQVAGGKAELLATRTLTAQIEALRGEVERLRNQLQQIMRTGGYAELSGPGVVIQVEAKPNRNGEEQPIYATDIRDMVNELLAAGALGVEVGGQRLVSTTSIRSVGDQILVNQQPVVTRPLTIKAVGDPGVLRSSLDLIRNMPYFPYRLEVEEYSLVTLSARQAPGV
jgi:hypothetical protein